MVARVRTRVQMSIDPYVIQFLRDAEVQDMPMVNRVLIRYWLRDRLAFSVGAGSLFWWGVLWTIEKMLLAST